MVVVLTGFLMAVGQPLHVGMVWVSQFGLLEPNWLNYLPLSNVNLSIPETGKSRINLLSHSLSGEGLLKFIEVTSHCALP